MLEIVAHRANLSADRVYFSPGCSNRRVQYFWCGIQKMCTVDVFCFNRRKVIECTHIQCSKRQ